MMELCSEYLSVWCIWLYVIIMSRTSFRVNLHFVVYLSVKELLARSRRHIWSLSDCNGIRTHNHFVRKRTLNHLAKLVKWLSCVVSTYLYGVFDCMLLSYIAHEFQSESTLYSLPECQGIPCSKQAPYLTFKWLQRDLNP